MLVVPPATALTDLPGHPSALIWAAATDPRDRCSLVMSAPEVFGGHVRRVALVRQGDPSWNRRNIGKIREQHRMQLHPLLAPTAGAWKLMAHMSSSALADLDLGTFADDAEATSVLGRLSREIPGVCGGIRKFGLRVQDSTDVAATISAISATFPSLVALRYNPTIRYGTVASSSACISGALRLLTPPNLRSIDLVVEVWGGSSANRGRSASASASASATSAPATSASASAPATSAPAPATSACVDGVRRLQHLEVLNVRVWFEDPVGPPGDNACADNESVPGARSALDAVLTGLGTDSSIVELTFEACGFGANIVFEPERWPTMPSLRKLVAPNVTIGGRDLWVAAPSLREVKVWSMRRDAPSGSAAHLRTLMLSDMDDDVDGELLEFPPRPAARAFTSAIETIAPGIEIVVLNTQTTSFGGDWSSRRGYRWSHRGSTSGSARRVEFEKRRHGSTSNYNSNAWLALYTAVDMAIQPYIIA